MKILLITVLATCYMGSVYGWGFGLFNLWNIHVGILRPMFVISERAEIRENGRGGWLFPEEIDVSVDIDGLGLRRFQARKSKEANKRPRVLRWLSSISQVWRDRRKQAIEYYVNSQGSFACKLSFLNGRPQCNLMGIIHEANETCFFKNNVAHCEEKIEGTLESYEVPEDPNEEAPVPVATVPYPGNRTDTTRASKRKRRQATELGSTTRVVQIAFYLDAAFMNRFYRLNPGNDDEAEDNAEMYIKMAANEMTYRYQTVKDLNIRYRGGILDLAVNPSVIIYPRKGSDFTFLVKDSTYTYSGSLTRFRNYINSNPPGARWDHGMLVSGLNLYSSSPSLLGSAYLSTVCATNSFRLYRVSMNEDRAYNLVDTAAHELGHALGAQHDNFQGNGGNSCPSRTYIMSASATRATSNTRDTLFTFSRCSGQYFGNHLSRFPDCLSRSSDSDFRRNFCAGPRGLRETSFDYQCQTYWNYGPGYTECYGTEKVGRNDCWRQNQIFCYPGTGELCYALPYLADGSPCAGPNSGKSYYCYLGNCVEEDEICSGGPPPTVEPTPPPPPPPTQPPCFCDSLSSFFGRLFCCLASSCC